MNTLPYQERWQPDQVQQCVQLWDLTPNETQQLLQLKEAVRDLHHHWANGPFELIRFVLEPTCKQSVSEMEHRVRQCVEWRQENGIDSILEEYAPPIICWRFPAAIMKQYDKEGDVVVVVRSGAGDPLGLLHRYGRDELIRSLFWGNEFAVRGPWQQGLRPKLITAVVDLKGLNRRHYHPSLLWLAKELSHPLQRYYPHLVKKVLVINAPAIFRFVWTLFQPFVLPHLRQLMEVATEAQSEQLLSEYMELSVLPKEIVGDNRGIGEVVKGLSPDWDGTLPNPSSDDWRRIPLIYPPSKKNKEDNVRTPATASLSAQSSLGSYNMNIEGGCADCVESSGKSLFRGNWTDNHRVVIA